MFSAAQRVGALPMISYLILEKGHGSSAALSGLADEVVERVAATLPDPLAPEWPVAVGGWLLRAVFPPARAVGVDVPHEAKSLFPWR